MDSRDCYRRWKFCSLFEYIFTWDKCAVLNRSWNFCIIRWRKMFLLLAAKDTLNVTLGPPHCILRDIVLREFWWYFSYVYSIHREVHMARYCNSCYFFRVFHKFVHPLIYHESHRVQSEKIELIPNTSRILIREREREIEIERNWKKSGCLCNVDGENFMVDVTTIFCTLWITRNCTKTD